MFDPPMACTHVAGEIVGWGWCEDFEADQAHDIEWHEEDHPRREDGKFGTGGGATAPGGGSTPAKAGSTPSSGLTATARSSGQAPPSFKTKKDQIGHLLTQEQGTTTSEVLKATGWPSVSMPAAAKAARMVLTKEKVGRQTVYRGRPMTADEEAAAFPPKVRAAIARGRGPAGRDPTTFSLVEHLAANGGIKANDPLVPDLQQIIGRKNLFVPGFGQLIRPTGKPLDQAREAAVEATYLYDIGFITAEQQNTTVRTLLDAIDREMRGEKQYRQGYEPPEDIERMRDAWDQELDNELEGVDIDPASVSGPIRDRVLEIMERERGSNVLTAYERAVFEDTQARADAGEVERIPDDIPDWDVPDEPGAAPAAGRPAAEIPF